MLEEGSCQGQSPPPGGREGKRSVLFSLGAGVTIVLLGITSRRVLSTWRVLVGVIDFFFCSSDSGLVCEKAL